MLMLSCRKARHSILQSLIKCECTQPAESSCSCITGLALLGEFISDFSQLALFVSSDQREVWQCHLLTLRSVSSQAEG